MLNLIAKDFKLLFSSRKSKKNKILSIVFSTLLGMIIIAIETFLFTTIINKIKIYPNAVRAFFTIFLFIVSLCMLVMALEKANKLLYNELDFVQLTPYPIDNSKKVLSKMLSLFIVQYFTCLVFTLPLFISYGVIMRQPVIYYYLAIFYPVLTFIFEGGAALVLVYPFNLIKNFLKKHRIIEFITNLMLLVTLTYIYSLLLGVFKTLVSTNNLDTIFTEDVLNKAISISRNLIPITFLTKYFINFSTMYLFSYFAIAGGIFVIGLLINIYCYNLISRNNTESVGKVKKKVKVRRCLRALCHKEVILLFGNSDFFTSYTGLLVIQPFLTYLITSTMNIIVTRGPMSYFFSTIPFFVSSLDVLLSVLIMLIIAQGANNYIRIEGKSLPIIKTIPVSRQMQINAKVVIPFSFSLFTVLVSLIGLWAMGIMTFKLMVFAFIVALSHLFISTMTSLREEMRMRVDVPRSTLLSSLVYYALPIFCFVVSIVLAYFNYSKLIIVVSVCAILLFASIPCLINFDKKVDDNFINMGVCN